MTLAMLAAAAGVGATDAPVAADAAAFAQAVQACSVARFAHPHPLLRGFSSEHAVLGQDAGGCRYTQSMPGGMRMDCVFDAAGREAFAAEFTAMAAGQFKAGGQSQGWQQACTIVDKDGKRMPLAG